MKKPRRVLKNPSRTRFIFGPPPSFYDPLVAIGEEPSAISASVRAFKDNLSSAITVGSIPFQLAQSSVLHQRFAQIRTAERIRSLAVDEGTDDRASEKLAYNRAKKAFTREITDQETIEDFGRQTLTVLDGHLSDKEFSDSADELLRQVLVIAWGAFETLVSDSLRSVLNCRPELSLNLFSERQYRDVLIGKNTVLELERRNFDLSKSMGDIVFDTFRMDGLEKIRDVCSIIFNNDELNVFLKNDALWTLSQRRNLIVHRRGLVDSRYLSKTGDTRSIGDRLTLTASEIEDSLVVVRDAGVAFARAATV
ncbi:MAG: hypothetical protein K5872_20880 [Rhizobiaceae bacterium]|nr:hypothetical protein [Rhizobiaceae bacterium]MCV0408673.1 hypothetical protein [Rhizobiaceae bacterium]